jgi:hypothetical protein
VVEYVPTWQTWHFPLVVAPWYDEYVPATHRVQLALVPLPETVE